MKTKKILICSLLAACMAITITACYKEKMYNSNGTNTQMVKMQNSAFTPASLTVAINSAVTWINNDTIAHTVTASDGSFDSDDIAPGASFSKTFANAGTINYHDTHNSSMTGVIVVSGSAGGGY